MRYAEFGPNREWSSTQGERGSTRVIGFADVFAEAQRRKRRLNLDYWQMEEYVTGDPIPVRVQQLVHEIDRAADALARMSPIPIDFADDVFWPRVF